MRQVDGKFELYSLLNEAAPRLEEDVAQNFSIHLPITLRSAQLAAN